MHGLLGLFTPFQDLMSGVNPFEDAVFARLDLWWTFLAVPLVVGAYAWGARARARALEGLGNRKLVERLVATVNPGNRIVKAITTTGAVLLLGLTLLRMQYGGVAEVIPGKGLDVVLAVDYSKSMLAQDVYPSRSERLEAELSRFFDDAQRRGDRVGVVVFAGAARGMPLTGDTRLLRMYLEKADPATEEPGGTAIGRALDMSLQLLREARAEQADAPEAAEDEAGADVADGEQADQVIILLTDGEDNVSDPLLVAEEAAKLGVRIYTVGIGSRTGEPIVKLDDNGKPDGFQRDADGEVIMTRLDEATLKELAERTDGAYVHVDEERFGLDEVRELMADLARAEREETIKIHRQEGYAFYLTPALLLLLVSLALGERREVRS